MYDDYYDEDEAGGGWRKRVKIAAVVMVALVGWFVVRPQLQHRLTDASAQSPDSSPSLESTASTDDTATSTTAPRSTATSSTSPARPATTTTTTPAAATATTRVAVSTTAPGGAAQYKTLPDGNPVPVVATFYPDRTTLSGDVPSAEAATAFTELAAAYGQPDVPVDNQLTVNQAVPIGVGLRMLDLRSPAFPEAAADITPELGTYLDRVGEVLVGRPSVSVVVVGHADQRGNAEENLVLSLRRAQTVLEYLLGRGVAGSRLSARAVGEADLLSLGNDEAALALNRRTEFIVYGLLVSAPEAVS
jgi:outer membrane protein OmpA-like peptidoglycan-associated protein